ncbi:MAG: YcxB family protein [Oscillospiraceae bacterium]|nr:YcxB family protein [Oscillospiraceae bacterium]
MTYVFRTTTYDVEALMPELKQALLKRSELMDAAAAEARARDPRAKTPEQMAAKKRISRSIYGIVLLVLAVYLVLMAVQQPERRVLAGIAAAWAFGAAAWTILHAVRPNPNEGKKTEKDFEKPARGLLTHIAKAEPCEISFDEKGMTFAGAPTVLYRDLEYFVETPSAYLVSWTNKAATFLQKKDFLEGDMESFADFVIMRL